jgi:hypothetical protein
MVQNPQPRSKLLISARGWVGSRKVIGRFERIVACGEFSVSRKPKNKKPNHNNMENKIRKQLIQILEEGKEIPLSFRDILFSDTDKKMEYELVYGIKQREEDILADT